MMPLTPLEAAVLEHLLRGQHPALVALRHQLPLLQVKARDFSGVGFFTEFEMVGKVEPAPVRSERVAFGDVEATIEGLKHGAGFVLFVQDGVLEMLEGYTYDEPWPASVRTFSLSYSDSSRQRVLDKLG